MKFKDAVKAEVKVWTKHLYVLEPIKDVAKVFGYGVWLWSYVLAFVVFFSFSTFDLWLGLLFLLAFAWFAFWMQVAARMISGEFL